MKNKILTGIVFLLAASWLFNSCETDMQKAQDAYDATQVIPRVISVSAPTSALQTFAYPFSVTYDRAGSSWAWSAEGATVQSVSTDTKTASIMFTAIPAGDTAKIKVIETTSGGVASPERVMKVKVNPYCPLTGGLADLVGTWAGTDGQGADYTFATTTVTTTVDGTKLKVSGANVDFMANFWGENIVSGGTFLVTINNNGTLDIPQQYFCRTDWDSDYDIKGSGKWDNCSATPKLIIDYDIYYHDGPYWLAARYKSYLDGLDYLTLDITMN